MTRVSPPVIFLLTMIMMMAQCVRSFRVPNTIGSSSLWSSKNERLLLQRMHPRQSTSSFHSASGPSCWSLLPSHSRSSSLSRFNNDDDRIVWSYRNLSTLYSTSSTDHENSSSSSSSRKKRVVFLGTPEVAATSLRRLHEDTQRPDCDYEIVCVITQPPKRRRRKGQVEPSPVGAVAEELGIQVLAPETARDISFLDRLEAEIRPDLCITAAYGQFLPKRFLSTPTLGTVNIHPSLLPRWRGASPVQRSLEAGDNPVGVTVLYTVSKMDAGPIIRQQEQVVDDQADTATKVLPWLFGIGTDLLMEVLPDVLSGKVTMDRAQVQDESQVVQAAMIDSSEAELKPWKETAWTMHNRLRGFSMWPGAYLYLQVGDTNTAPVKYKILETRVLEEETMEEPTDVVTPGPNKKDGLRLASAVDGSVLEILRLQPATKKPVDALSFVNGLQGRSVRYVKAPETAVASSAAAASA